MNMFGILKLIFWTGIVCITIGFGLLGFVQHRHAFGHGIFRGFTVPLSDANKRFLKFGLVFLSTGAVLLISVVVLK
jgi:hypothetical protein